MKKILYASFASLFLFLGSCTKENDSSKTPAPVDLNKIVGTDVITETSTYPFITSYDKARSATARAFAKSGQNGSANARTATWTVFGPYTVTPTLTKILTNYNMVLVGHPTLPIASYLCDIYESRATVYIPAESTMLFNNPSGASKIGYQVYQNQTSGINVTQTVGNAYTFVTYSIVPRYNMNGQQLFVSTMPRDLTGNVYTYSYLRDI